MAPHKKGAGGGDRSLSFSLSFFLLLLTPIFCRSLYFPLVSLLSLSLLFVIASSLFMYGRLSLVHNDSPTSK